MSQIILNQRERKREEGEGDLGNRCFIVPSAPTMDASSFDLHF
jgi:hypothetical protein